MEARVVARLPTHTFVGIGPCLCQVWRAPPTLAAMHAYTQWLTDASRAGPVVTLTVAEGATVPVSAELRSHITRLMQRTASRVLAAAHVHEAGGFASAHLQGMITGLAREAERREPRRMFADLPSAAAWLATVSLTPFDPSEFVSILTRHRGYDG